MESCVKNQTLRDDSCLVPCVGLFADIADDIDSLKLTTQALEQNVIRGRFNISLYSNLRICARFPNTD